MTSTELVFRGDIEVFFNASDDNDWGVANELLQQYLCQSATRMALTDVEMMSI